MREASNWIKSCHTIDNENDKCVCMGRRFASSWNAILMAHTHTENEQKKNKKKKQWELTLNAVAGNWHNKFVCKFIETL